MKNYAQKLLDNMSYKEHCALNKKLFGHQSNFTDVAHFKFNSALNEIAKLEKEYPSDYVLRQLEFWRKELKECQDYVDITKADRVMSDYYYPIDYKSMGVPKHPKYIQKIATNIYKRFLLDDCSTYRIAEKLMKIKSIHDWDNLSSEDLKRINEVALEIQKLSKQCASEAVFQFGFTIEPEDLDELKNIIITREIDKELGVEGLKKLIVQIKKKQRQNKTDGYLPFLLEAANDILDEIQGHCKNDNDEKHAYKDINISNQQKKEEGTSWFDENMTWSLWLLVFIFGIWFVALVYSLLYWYL